MNFFLSSAKFTIYFEISPQFYKKQKHFHRFSFRKHLSDILITTFASGFQPGRECPTEPYHASIPPDGRPERSQSLDYT